ncbi:DUF2514 family protein [Pseudomonas sp. LRF_L74]|uniref:DUF2514 family protein n=1 Tax=Pseudomonas sp. LRF_L74 TaxID=3369422 RepID=UPI003F5F3FE5
MSWASAVPAWLWWVLALIAVGGGQQLRVSSLQVDLVLEQKAFSDHLAEDKAAVAKAETDARAEEQRQQKAIDGVRDEARGELEDARADAGRADERADGLQREVDRLRASRGATCDAIAAQRGQATNSAFDVLADLFSEVEREGRAMAAEADRRGVAGRSCEKAYGAVH